VNGISAAGYCNMLATDQCSLTSMLPAVSYKPATEVLNASDDNHDDGSAKHLTLP
jgi:hypothetical protein